MALTPAQRHRARVMAEKAQAASPFGIELQGSDYQLMLAKLATDKRTLKALQSVQLKRQTKAQLLPEYLPWIEGALSKGQGARDDVFTTTMVWAIDAGAYGLALRMAAYVLQHKLPLPDQYQRGAAAVLLDEYADAYLRGQWQPLRPGADEKGQPALVADETHPAEHLTALAGLTNGQDAPDQARAKLLKATAYALLGKVQTAEDPKLDGLPPEILGDVLALLVQALHLDAQSGVKKDIERIERKQRALANPASPASHALQGAADQASTADTAPDAAETQPATAAARRKTPAKPPARAAAKTGKAAKT
ncbi:phage terminase small subunit [Comamonas antarctica]|uniref:phage terminase small subunit n=1 Tax=Comamonas antarctica TaxID=2743470 RepID=UPI001ABB58B0|nr:phage terminase small subunit [Comamonas antarctica]